MTMADLPHGVGDSGVSRLRHDLLNSLNVLTGATTVLMGTQLTEQQRSCVQACQAAVDRLIDIIKRLEAYQVETGFDGRAQLADLCSIAAARVDKPFDRSMLLDAIGRVTSSATPRVLLVDDAPDIGVLVRAYLKETAATVDVVGDGERAVAQASSQPYDVVLMDVDLPGLDGATAAHAIRAADLARGARPTPVVALSAVGSEWLASRPDPSDDLAVAPDPEIASLAPAFLERRRSDVVALSGLLERGEYSGIQTLGHKMKGTGRSYGFSTVSRIGSDLESAAETQDANAIRRLIDELDGYLARVKTTATQQV
jgi:CheY-like chemotaxis protein/HPt (histidine-containing phosphotransfer) domain-containing protein